MCFEIIIYASEGFLAGAPKLPISESRIFLMFQIYFEIITSASETCPAEAPKPPISE